MMTFDVSCARVCVCNGNVPVHTTGLMTFATREDLSRKIHALYQRIDVDESGAIDRSVCVAFGTSQPQCFAVLCRASLVRKVPARVRSDAGGIIRCGAICLDEDVQGRVQQRDEEDLFPRHHSPSHNRRLGGARQDVNAKCSISAPSNLLSCPSSTCIHSVATYGS
jgi:hypothetical protein